MRILACLMVSLSCVGCSRVPRLTEYPGFTRFPYSSPDLIVSIPVILVGTITRHSSYVGDAHRSRWYWDGPAVQLLSVTVRVETVIQSDGGAVGGEVPVYFFLWSGSYSGPPRLGDWQVGDRVMFFLQRENNYLRTICDQYKSCTLDVLSGPHRDFRATYPQADVVKILLSRGEGVDDEHMIEAINRSNKAADVSPTETVRALRKLIAEETPAVAAAACQKLRSHLDSTCAIPPYPASPWVIPCFERPKLNLPCPGPCCGYGVTPAGGGSTAGGKRPGGK